MARASMGSAAWDELMNPAKSIPTKEAITLLKKYLAKKKTAELDPIVQRALSIKKSLTN
jgi:hypothetical protein